MKPTKTEKLNNELGQCENALFFFTPIYETNIDNYEYCHKAKKSKEFKSEELKIIKLQEEQSRLIIHKYKNVMKYLKRRTAKLKKKLGIKENPQVESQPGNE